MAKRRLSQQQSKRIQAAQEALSASAEHQHGIVVSHQGGQILVELEAGVCPLFFPILVRDKLQVQAHLEGVGIQTVNLWDRSHPSCPTDLADELSVWRDHCLELPIHQDLDQRDIDRIADELLGLGLDRLQ